MGYIRKLPSGKYQGTVRLPNGKKTTTTGLLRRDVKVWIDDTEAALRKGITRDPKAGQTLFEDFMRKHLDARVLERSTRRNEESTARNHVLPKWSGHPLQAISRLDVQAWVRSMERKDIGTEAIRKAYSSFAATLRSAVDEGLIGQTPCRRITLPQTASKPPKWFTAEQVDAIRAELPHSAAVMTELMVWCGLRWQEAAGLTAARIDFDRGRIHVMEVVDAYGNPKEYPKTSASRRELPAPAAVLKDIRELLDARGSTDGLIFRTPSSGRALHAANWRDRWHAAIRAANLKRGPEAQIPAWAPHTCRHTAASWLVQAGVPLYDVQKFLGHSSFPTTLKYAHLAPDASDTITAAWDRIERR